MSITPLQFIQKHTGQYVYIPGMSTAECVALFWAYNNEVNKGEAYSAVGACNLWQQPGTVPYIWDTYDRIPVGSGKPGDWGIWSGDFGAYPNGGYGHVALLVHDNGNGTGDFFTQNPNAPEVRTLNYSGTIGYLRPKGIEFDYTTGRPQQCIVEPGDTLSGIAAQFGVSLDDLINANPGINPDLIHPDQVLNLP